CLLCQSVSRGGLRRGLLDEGISLTKRFRHFIDLGLSFVSLRFSRISLRLGRVSQSLSIHASRMHFLPLLIEDVPLNDGNKKKTQGEKSHGLVSPLWLVFFSLFPF